MAGRLLRATPTSHTGGTVNAPQNPQHWPQQPPPGYPPQAGPQHPGGYGPPGSPQQPGPQQPGLQQPGLQPPGPQPHGPQQPGYGPPGAYGPQPPKKNRTGLVVGILAAVVVLVVGGVATTFLLDYYEQPGGGPGEQPIAECDLSPELKSQAHVSSFRLVEKPTHDKGLKRWNCHWQQTEGKDGRNPRGLTFYIYDYNDFTDKSDQNVDRAEGSYDDAAGFANGLQTKPVEGLGDEAMLIIEPTPRDSIDVKLIAREDAVVWSITYSGRDKGFISDSPMPLADAEAVVRKTAEELIAKR